ncbi:MAG TPA: hypothetical protein VK021_13505 [Flavobacteriaceae bacterium]|nr:hypothetical protein [Flavobacteriaceae bacterium]
MRFAIFLFAVFLLISCKDKTKDSDDDAEQQITDTLPVESSAAKLFVKQVEETHRSTEFKNHEAITFEVQSKSEQSAKKFNLQTDLKKIKMEMFNGDFAIFNEDSLYTSPDLPDEDLAAFKNIIQLFGLAFNLEDWTSKAKEKTTDSLQGENYTTINLDLKNAKYLSSTADLKVHIAPTTGFISAVTFSDKPSEENHLVLYENYFSIGRIPFPKHWEIYRDDISATNLIDKLTIAKLKFFQPSDDFFNPPAQAVLAD